MGMKPDHRTLTRGDSKSVALDYGILQTRGGILYAAHPRKLRYRPDREHRRNDGTSLSEVVTAAL